MKYFLYVILAIVILLTMIVIHELGHYVAGKIFKFKINEFSIGFGPLIFSKTNKKTGEKFSLRMIPLGGYCAFEDENGLETDEKGAEELVNPDEVFEETTPVPVMPPCVDPLNKTEEKPAKSFVEEEPWKRIIVLFAGAFFNFVSAIIFSFVFILVVGYSVPVVQNLYVNAEGAPYCAELRTGDEIIAVDGVKIGIMKGYDELLVDKTDGRTYVLTVIRDGEEIDVAVKMQQVSAKIEDKQQEYIGLGMQISYKGIRSGAGYALCYAVPYTGKLSLMVLQTFGGLITGRIPLNQMTGPVGTIKAVAQFGMIDWRYILLLLPLIASNLAIFNVLPIPALDGSKIVFTLIEWIRKKPINRKVENVIHAVGMLLLFGFVIIIDILGFVL